MSQHPHQPHQQQQGIPQRSPQQQQGSPPPAKVELHELYFTGKDDPRAGCIMIGYVGERPIYYHFETGVLPMGNTRTIIYRNESEAVAYFDWNNGTQPGTLTYGNNQQVSMSWLVMPGSNDNCRSFIAISGSHFEWRRAPDEHGQLKYDLYAGPTSMIATYFRFPQPKDTPVGPSYGMMKFKFDDDNLLVSALMALSLNMWKDYTRQ